MNLLSFVRDAATRLSFFRQNRITSESLPANKDVFVHYACAARRERIRDRYSDLCWYVAKKTILLEDKTRGE